VVAPIENLTTVRGTITARRAHPRLSGWDLVTLVVEHIEPVPGTPDLLSPWIQGDLELAVRRELLGEAPPGARLSCRAKVTPQGAMCEPHPHAEDFTISTD